MFSIDHHCNPGCSKVSYPRFQDYLFCPNFDKEELELSTLYAFANYYCLEVININELIGCHLLLSGVEERENWKALQGVAGLPFESFHFAEAPRLRLPWVGG